MNRRPVLVWSLIAAPPLCLFLLALALSLSARPVAPATGDALLDACLAPLSGMLTTPTCSSSIEVNLADAIPPRAEAQLDALARQYGRQPAYWRIRYELAASTGDLAQYASPYAMVKVARATSFLERAREKKAVDGAVILRLLLDYESAWRKEYGDTGFEMAKRQRLAGGGLERESARLTRGIIDRLHGELQTKLVNKLQRLAPNEAATYYIQAQLELERGHRAQATALLQRGNAAPLNSISAQYINSRCAAALAQGRPLSGSKPLTVRLANVCDIRLFRYDQVWLPFNYIDAFSDGELLTEFNRAALRRLESGRGTGSGCLWEVLELQGELKRRLRRTDNVTFWKSNKMLTYCTLLSNVAGSLQGTWFSLSSGASVNWRDPYPAVRLLAPPAAYYRGNLEELDKWYIHTEQVQQHTLINARRDAKRFRQYSFSK
jgi:hypothetical protein